MKKLNFRPRAIPYGSKIVQNTVRARAAYLAITKWFCTWFSCDRGILMAMTRLIPPSNSRAGGGTSLDATMSVGPSLRSMTSNGICWFSPCKGHPMRDDKSLCKCYGRKHESLAFNWRLSREMMLGSLQCLGVLLFWVIVGQGPAVLAFFLSPILSSFDFSISQHTRLCLTTVLSTGPLTRL